MKICTVVGARPQFVKAAAVSAKFAEMKKTSPEIEEVIVHTGQHYDQEMSKVFFDELKIPKEKYNLESGSGSHGAQTAKILERLEDVLIKEKPGRVLIYGDTNSTLAGALAAAKLNISCVHVEAGMRSFNRKMPEEINRIVADHLCEFNLCPTRTAMENLKREGLEKTSRLTGDVMFDCALKFGEIAEKHYQPLAKFAVSPGSYALMTCHRAENTDDRHRLSEIIDAANRIAESVPVIFPVHPRTKKFFSTYGFRLSDKILISTPASYLEMLVLEKNARMIITDSGGVQKEAFFFNVPCATMRDETEWVETVELGFNIITGADSKKILDAYAKFAASPPLLTGKEKPYGNGDAAEKIVRYCISGQ